MKQLKNYIKSQARDFISYEKWVSILSIVSIVIFLTNEIQEIYFSNPPYFLESLFRFTNIFYFLSLGLVVFIFYRRSALLLFILIVFYFRNTFYLLCIIRKSLLGLLFILIFIIKTRLYCIELYSN